MQIFPVAGAVFSASGCVVVWQGQHLAGFFKGTGCCRARWLGPLFSLQRQHFGHASVLGIYYSHSSHSH